MTDHHGGKAEFLLKADNQGIHRIPANGIETGGRFVEHVQDAWAGSAEQVRGQLDPLRLAPGEGVGGLAQAKVAEADLVEDLEASRHAVLAREELERLAHGQLQDLVDRPAPPLHLENRRAVPPAAAALADEVGVGEELQVDPDPETFTHALRVRIPGDVARSGSVARVRLPLRSLQQAVAVPSTAILQDDGNAYVFRLDGEVLRRTPVTTGRHVGELVVITAGLTGGERVVVRDVAALSEGMRVNAVQADRTAGP